MALEDMGGKSGSRPVEVVFADHQNKPDVGMQIARRWLDEEGVGRHHGRAELVHRARSRRVLHRA